MGGERSDCKVFKAYLVRKNEVRNYICSTEISYYGCTFVTWSKYSVAECRIEWVI